MTSDANGNGPTELYVRPIRNFGDDAEAYWLDPYLADGTKMGSMDVSPDVTTTYDAVVVFERDTFPLTGTVIVHEKYDKDTLYETVCSSPLPYTSAVNPIFKDLDISTIHDFEPVRVTLETQDGCDSIITLMLKVDSSYLFLENQYICISDTPYTWRGKQLSESGTYYDTLSTLCCSCDSVYQLNLTVMPLPEIFTAATIGACEGASVTLSATSANCADLTRESIHEGFNRVTGNESTNIAGQISSMTDYIAYGQYIYPVGATAIKIGSSNYTGSITTKPLDLSHDYTLTLMCKGNYNTSNPDNEYAALLKISVNGHVMDTLVIPANKDNHGYEPFTVNLPAATSSSTITLQTLSKVIPGNSWAEMRVLVDDIVISDNTPCSYVWWRGSSDTVSHDSVATVTPNVSAPDYQEYYYVQATSMLGCKATDSTLVMNLQIPLDESVKICSNELPYTWRDTIFEEGTAMNGTYVFHRTSVHGCDSIVTLTLTIYEIKRDTLYLDLLYDTISTTASVCTDRTIGEETSTTYRIPVGEDFKYSCSQQIFTPLEIGKPGPVNAISFNFSYSYKMNKKNNVKIYLAHTDKQTFSGSYDWVSPSSMILVYSGNLNCSKGWNEFALDNTFEYNGTDNLIVTVLDESGNMDGSSYKFYCTPSADNTCLYYNSSTPWSMTGVGTRYNYRSDIRFNICSQDTAITFAGNTFVVKESGVYSFIDTVPGSNGCDSVTVRYLIVEKPHEEEICDSVFTPGHIWVDSVGPYCWYANGKDNCIAGMTPDAYGYYEFPGTKTIEGFSVDTISYLKLTINPTHRDTDSVLVCLYEEPMLTTYELNGSVFTLSVTRDSVTITNSVAGVTVDTLDAANGDFVFKTQTTKGCDSVVIVHFDRDFVHRDTVYKDTVYSGGTVFCDDKTISEQNGQSYYTPINAYYRNSCTQQIFTSAEVGAEGTIDTISFNYASSAAITRTDQGKIYLAHTTKSSFTDNIDWTPDSVMTLVYEGSLNCSQGWNRFALDRPFEYNGTDNLMVMVIDESSTYESSKYFYYTNTSENRCLYFYSDSYTWNPSSSNGTRDIASYRSDIRFHVCDYPTMVFDGQTFTINGPGTYTLYDTVPGSNGCDSVIAYNLIVNELYEDVICDSTFTVTYTWVDNVGTYTWNGYPLPPDTNANGYYEIHSDTLIDGALVDVVSYLKLTINPTYRDTDSVQLCIFEEPMLTTYDLNGSVFTLSVTEDSVAITNTIAGIIVDTIDAANGDFAFKMTTDKGCDSVIIVHFDRVLVQRDTVYKDTLILDLSLSCSDRTIGSQQSYSNLIPFSNWNKYS